MVTEKELTKMAKLAYETASLKGWHKEKRNYHDLIALINSELGEAVEELRIRKDHLLIIKNEGKPEGFLVEIADFIIRIFDFVGYFSESGDQPYQIMAKGYTETLERVSRDVEVTLPVTTLVCVLGKNLFTAWQDFQTQRATEGIFMFGVMIATIDDWMYRSGVSMKNIVTSKMSYNTTRPERHGGKLL